MTQATPKLFTYGFRWDTKQPLQRVTMRILSFDIDSLIETSHHTIFIEKNGKKRPYNFECLKGSLFGDRRNEVACPACASERYPKQRGEKYLWFLDLQDIDTQSNQPKLKWTTITYSLAMELKNHMEYYGQGRPLFQIPLVLERQKSEKKTTYVVRGIPNMAQVDNFDLNAWLLSNNLTELPPIVGDKSVFPPIIKVTPAEMNSVAAGQLPWGTTQAQPAVQPQAYTQPFVGQAPVQPAYAQVAPQPAQVVNYGQPMYQQPQQQVYTQPVAQPVVQPTVQSYGYAQQPVAQPVAQPVPQPHINIAQPVAHGQAIDNGAYSAGAMAVEVNDIDMQTVVDQATAPANVANPVKPTTPIF